MKYFYLSFPLHEKGKNSYYFEGPPVAVALLIFVRRRRYSATFLFIEAAFATPLPSREPAGSGVGDSSSMVRWKGSEGSKRRAHSFIVYIRISPIVISMSYVYFYISSYLTFIFKPHPTLHHCTYISASHLSSYPCHMSIFISHVFIFIPHRTLHHIHHIHHIQFLHHSPQCLMFILIPFLIIISHFKLGLFLPFLFITPLCVDSLVCTFTVTVLSSFI